MTLITHNDDGTSTPGRSLLRQKVCERVARGEPFGLILCDIDRFKLINYSLGHEFGDRVLRQVAQVLHDTLGPTSTTGRWGGPEFLCIIDDVTQLDAQVERLRERIERLVVLSTTSRIHITASFGVASYPDDGRDAEDLLNAVDAALYHAKEWGRNRVVRATVVQKRVLGMGVILEAALHENRIVPAYQPIVSLKDGVVVGEEALARLRLPNGRLLAAEEFIEVSRQLQLTYKIDQSVIRATLERCMAARREPRAMTHFVNISGNLLRHPDAVQELLELVRGYCKTCQTEGQDRRALVLELTERELFGDIAHAKAMLLPFVEAGLKLALDDFGHGYSSFQYLADLPFSFLKIEGSLIQRLTERTTRKIVEGIQRIATELGIRTLAEGVETPEIARIVEDLGIDWAQGFLYDKARPGDLPNAHAPLWQPAWNGNADQ
ncbi:MAG: bifunctional diguanylate cyclase/phosphodiesterase [Gammaproteobacteria bacterium]|nr:bifunctional diguanylate cyclase/phosphodiesterase [Gammaproteobacteria bacterium]